MGQRLNIEIVDSETVLANAYYHWSAYSETSAKLTKLIIDNFDKTMTENENPTLFAIRMLELTGAGLTDNQPESELAEAKKLFGEMNFKECQGRNSGLIAITKEGTEETRSWEEGRVTIDIATRKINFNVWFRHTNSDRDEYSLIGEPVKVSFNPHSINFEQIGGLITLIKEIQEKDCDFCFDNMPLRELYSFEKDKDIEKLDLQIISYSSIY